MQMRIKALVVAIAGSMLLASGAQAIPSVNLVWRTPGGPVSTIDTSTLAAPSSNVVADIVLISDDPAVNGVFISIEFDNVGLEVLGSTELAVVKLPGMANTMSPLGLGTALNQAAGLVTNFDQATLSAVACGLGCNRTLGSVRFHVNAGAGGSGAIASLQNTGVDAITAVGSSVPVAANFNGVSITPTPEPTTALLVLAGIAGLGYAGRRTMS